VTRIPLVLQVLRDPARLSTLTLADWDLLLRQASAAMLQASLRSMLAERGLLEQVPARPREHLEWAHAMAERHSDAVHWEVEQIRLALADVPIPLLLLKGGAYAMAGLPAAAGRVFTDIDILVPKDRLPAVEAALMLRGWASAHHDEYDQRYYRQWMHELPPMVHLKRRSLIDVHHAILPETAAVRPDPVLLRAAAVPIPGEDGLSMLSPTDMVLHSAVHLFYDGEFNHGMRDLLDLHRLLLHFGAVPGFWDALGARANTLQLARPLFYALHYCSMLLHTPVPSQAFAAAVDGRPPAPLLALMDQLFRRALLPDHPSCNDWLTGAARFLLYIRGNWLRMPPLMLARHLFHKAFISEK
jgi:hypothetical protein